MRVPQYFIYVSLINGYFVTVLIIFLLTFGIYGYLLHSHFKEAAAMFDNAKSMILADNPKKSTLNTRKSSSRGFGSFNEQGRRSFTVKRETFRDATMREFPPPRNVRTDQDLGVIPRIHLIDGGNRLTEENDLLEGEDKVESVFIEVRKELEVREKDSPINFAGRNTLPQPLKLHRSIYDFNTSREIKANLKTSRMVLSGRQSMIEKMKNQIQMNKSSEVLNDTIILTPRTLNEYAWSFEPTYDMPVDFLKKKKRANIDKNHAYLIRSAPVETNIIYDQKFIEFKHLTKDEDRKVFAKITRLTYTGLIVLILFVIMSALYIGTTILNNPLGAILAVYVSSLIEFVACIIVVSLFTTVKTKEKENLRKIQKLGQNRNRINKLYKFDFCREKHLEKDPHMKAFVNRINNAAYSQTKIPNIKMLDFNPEHQNFDYYYFSSFLSIPTWVKLTQSSTMCTFRTSRFVDIYLCHCLLYTSPSPRDGLLSRMPSSA
eukprot:TRINITY_DN3550_c0_g1_i3.p1 TRINITY_DN3550_c0_g1~~TRINITY_DN3550_c0_g1_i3.p1  ORF type:complete len:489 (+),score=69.04 TRINITY_DN3550_c0_g1_i3:627-2093(+)